MEQAIRIGQHSSTWQVQEDLEAGLQGIMAVREVNVEREPPFTVVFTGRLLCDAETALPILEQRFAAAGCVPLIRRHGQDDMVVAVEHTVTASKPYVWLKLLLLGATFVTTMAAGAWWAGVDVWRNPIEILTGLPFAVTLLIILGTHELGHYFMGRWHGVQVSLPYFIPMPISILGTFGAFIRMNGPIRNRRQLFDVGFAGPLAGFVVALPLFILGLLWSEVTRLPDLGLGDSLLTALLKELLQPTLAGQTLQWNLVAIAAYFGILLTGVNLLPAGQLDGGHIAYSLFGRLARPIALVTVAVLVVMGRLVWTGWFVWAVFILLSGLRHPTPLDDVTPLDRGRVLIGVGAFLLFVLTLIPVPFSNF
jgi:membrane-associated protease RseP (regulator of RpoE activity)